MSEFERTGPKGYFGDCYLGKVNAEDSERHSVKKYDRLYKSVDLKKMLLIETHGD